jgi:hypothetical protein
MSILNIRLISTIQELYDKRYLWDDLWERSSIETPLARSDLIIQYIEQFNPNAMFCALVVESNGRFVTALPFAETRRMYFVSAGINPSNEWSLCGQLLVDFSQDAISAIELLVTNLNLLPYSILWLDYIRINDPEWVLFKNAITKHKISSQWLHRYHTAVVSIPNDCQEMFSLFSKKEIANIRRKIRKFYSDYDYKLLEINSPDNLSDYLHNCFELENRGWKGDFGGSILNRKMDIFFKKIAVTLCKNKSFSLYLLLFKNKIIAFRYCISTKNTVFSLKTSYDPAYRDYAPGQVITYLIFESLCQDDNIKKFDFFGEFMPNQKVWNPALCPVGQIVIPLDNYIGKSFFFLYNNLMPKIRNLRENKLLKKF